MSLAELRCRYAELFGEPTRSGHKPHLVRRIAWRLQALAEGGLSERARQRARELVDESDLRLTAPRPTATDTATQAALRAAATAGAADERLPRPGTMLTRRYKGTLLQVKVLPQGFEYAGSRYRSLSVVAKAITGCHCNGFLFFRLKRKEEES